MNRMIYVIYLTPQEHQEPLHPLVLRYIPLDVNFSFGVCNHATTPRASEPVMCRGPRGFRGPTMNGLEFIWGMSGQRFVHLQLITEIVDFRSECSNSAKPYHIENET